MTHTSKIEKKALHDYGYQRLNSDKTNFSNDPLWMNFHAYLLYLKVNLDMFGNQEKHYIV